MGTTPSGYPYPEDTDLLSQGAQAIKALATKIDTQLGKSATGRASVVVSNAATGSVVVTFPVGRFTSQPFVVVATNNTAWIVGVSGQSATSFTAGVRQYGGTLSTGTILVDWVASII